MVLISLIAGAAPLLASLTGRVAKVPLVVFEIVLGIVIDPSMLGWVQPTEFIKTLSELGLAMLFFMAGNEIDFAAIKGRPVNRAALAWLISLGAGVAAGVLLTPTPEAGVLVGIALSSTALGTLLPILRDAGETKSPFGRTITAIGTVGEFGPLLAISLFLSGRNLGPSAILLLVFVLIVGLSIWLTGRGKHQSVHRLMTATLHTSGQFAVRLVLLIIAILVALSLIFGLDMLLVAIAAGILWCVLMAGASRHDAEVVEIKLAAVAFGLLVPVFFINTGISFDLAALLADPFILALVPIFLILFLVVRGLPNLLAAPVDATWSDRRATVLFSSTGLPITVAVTAIGRSSGLLPSGIATALIGAGMLSVLLFPFLALDQRRRRPSAVPPDSSRTTA
ncbi:cation:proton antiporter [Paenarthrobacter sp. PH39-S1]|uniref:cation:proton antiporter n=1 Tax=Paenarthrobacter sp. PH39-S1 TaxID=3046204 RepID=UPI0024BB7245|nr:cation:proton antiporter [Paenarthrobacter sp. PH39-S1]MDJ0354530.1 cation:proton antiporter [Paenarthrobacter sp. PH39-S1]